MKLVDQSRYIDAFDQVLLPLGFSRKKRAQEWLKQVDTHDLLWVHLNFGLASIGPSFGVQYTDIKLDLSSDADMAVGSMGILSEVTDLLYSETTSAAKLSEDLIHYGLPALRTLQDRKEVIRRLETTEVKEWPVPSASHRKRLLPLLLANQGEIKESLVWLARFEFMPDQLKPSYDTFAQCFRAKYGS